MDNFTERTAAIGEIVEEVGKCLRGKQGKHVTLDLEDLSNLRDALHASADSVQSIIDILERESS